MKKVFIVCGKVTEESFTFWIAQVCTSKKKAELTVNVLNEANPKYYHYYFEEPVF